MSKEKDVILGNKVTTAIMDDTWYTIDANSVQPAASNLIVEAKIRATLRVDAVSKPEYMPSYESLGAAGADLKISQDAVLPAFGTHLVGTGVKVAIPDGYVGIVVPRSSTGKLRIRLANGTGIIDSDYRGEIKLFLENNIGQSQFVPEGTRLAQILFVPVIQASFTPVDSLEESKRGEGGFGSTGNN